MSTLTHTETDLLPPRMRAASRSTIATTLYDVMANLQAEVGSDDENAVIAIMVNLLRSGQITFPGNRRAQVVG